MPKKRDIEANPARGKRGDFERVTITMPPEMLDALEDIRRKRKRAKEKNSDISSLIREAIVYWLGRTA